MEQTSKVVVVEDGDAFIEVPTYLVLGILRYVVEGIPTGGFLAAVLENDLVVAVGQADTTSWKYLGEIVTLMTTCLPTRCWGSAEKRSSWNGWANTAQGEFGECPSELRRLIDSVPEWDGWRPKEETGAT